MNERVKQILWTIALLITTFTLGAIDWLTGIFLNFYVFYFIPVSLSAWIFGVRGMVLYSVLCSIIWLVADVISGSISLYSTYALWNSLIRLISFLAIGFSIWKIHSTLLKERQAVAELKRTLSEVKVLRSFLPICSVCKSIRDEEDNWHRVEEYISRNVDTQFSHGYCPECYETARKEAGLD